MHNNITTQPTHLPTSKLLHLVLHSLLFTLCLFLVPATSAQSSAATLIPIYLIQGNGLASPLYQQWIDTYGLVTGIVADGFYLQDPMGDDDPATSDGLFVYTRDAPTVAVGQCVQLQRAYVDEFYEKTELSRIKAILPSTECSTTTVAPTMIPHPQLGHDPVALYEQVEGMLVAFAPLTATVQGPTKHFADGEAELALLPTRLVPYIEASRAFQSDTETMSGLLYLTNALGAILPDLRHGDQLRLGVAPAVLDAATAPAEHAIRAIIDYNFGKYQLLLAPDTPLTPRPSGVRLLPEVAAPLAEDAFSLCTYNLHGMGRGSEQYWEPERYDRQLAKRARTIAETLHGCTIIGLQELGTPADLERLITLLQGGFGLEYAGVALPGPGTLSNEYPLTLGLLARRDTTIIKEAAGRQGCSAQDYAVTRLADDCPPGTFPLFNRPPLVATVTVSGTWTTPFPLTVIVNHWKSKGGDENINVVRRTAQAAHVATLVQEQLTPDPAANVIVLGDLNDYYASDPVETLRTGTNPPLFHPYAQLRPLDRYTYIFNGGSQVLDHMLVTANLITRLGIVDTIHVNADFPSADEERLIAIQRSSDHDPIQLQIHPTGVGIVEGNLAYTGITVTLTITDDAGLSQLVAETVTDALGEYRLWSVPPGTYEVHIDAPAHFNKSKQTGILSVAAGQQTIVHPPLHHPTMVNAAATMRLAPELITAIQRTSTD